MTTKDAILQCVTHLFSDKGLKFTMDDITKELHIAKKTIYAIFPSKEDILLELLEVGFHQIQMNKLEILHSDLPFEEKLRKVMISMPDQYDVIDFRLLSDLKEKYPVVYQKLNQHLEADWMPIIQLMEDGQKKGLLNEYNILILKSMTTSCFVTFLSTDVLKENNITYKQALNDMMQILMRGMIACDNH